MLGLMQNRPLLVSTLIDYAATWHGDREIVLSRPDGVMHRSNYAAVAARAKRVANALEAMGVGFGQPVATLAWNGVRHLELYYGVIGSGRILHTVNPRLFPEQIQYIINHAEDGYVFFDPTFVALVEQLAPHLPLVRGWIALCEAADMPAVKVDNLLCYETIVTAASADYAWPVFDENTASTLCYTSGTTGNPKVCSTAIARPCCMRSAPARLICLPSRARFRSWSWCRCFTRTPGAYHSPRRCVGRSWFCRARGSIPRASSCCWSRRGARRLAGFPTIWLNFLAWVEAKQGQLDLSRLKLKRVFSGGTAPPRATIEKFRDLLGVFLLHAWGMTETSSIVTVGSPLAKDEARDPDEIVDMQVRQGRQMYGVELKLVGADGQVAAA